MQLSSSAVCLYFYLLNVSNKSGWNGFVVLSDAKITADLSVQRTALSTARTALENAGLIRLQNRGNGRGKTVYDIISPQIKNCTKRAVSHQSPTPEETAQNMQISSEENCTKRAYKNVKNCTENCTKRAVSYIINNILSNSNELSNIFSYKTKNNIIDSEYKYSSSTISGCGDAGDVVKKFLEEITDTHFVQHATIALSISEGEYFSLIDSVISEWLLSAPENFLPKNSPHKHLINQVRIKRDCPGEQKAQASARAKIIREQKQKVQAEQRRQEESEQRGRSGLDAFLASKGLKPGDSILATINLQDTEEDAIRELREKFPSKE